MKKKVWTMPLAVAERFKASEYIAACYSVTCGLNQTCLDYLAEDYDLVLFEDKDANGKFDGSTTYETFIDTSDLCGRHANVPDTNVETALTVGKLKAPYIEYEAYVLVPYKNSELYVDEAVPVFLFVPESGHTCISLGPISNLPTNTAS